MVTDEFGVLKDGVPRLVISKMVLINFKSYAGSIEIGPFHKSFTSIVGPNGSGKSNVIDSLLFVFGFKAKKLRQGKLSELIHNSEHHPDLRSCSVQVHFEQVIDLPEGAFEVVPESQFVVSRTVEKRESHDGKVSERSFYQLDGTVKTYQDIQTLLKGHGVDLDHKRFLILQGEVESIALMKPKGQNENEDGLLEYLEDIIGTNKYKQGIEEAEKQLDALNQVREEKLSHMKLVQKETHSLEEKSKEAVAYIETENEVARLQNQIIQAELHHLQAEMAVAEQEKAKVEQQLEEDKERQKELGSHVSELEKQAQQSKNELKALEDECAKAKADLSKYERQEVEMKETEKHLSQKRKKLAKAIHQETLQLSEDQTWIANFETDVAKAEKQKQDDLVRLKKEEKLLQDIQLELQDKTIGFQQEIEQQQANLAPWQEKLNTIDAKKQVALSEYQILENKINEAKNGVQIAQERLDALKQQSYDIQSDLEDADLNGLEAVLEEKKQAVQTLRQQQKEKKSQLASLVQKMDEVKQAMQSEQSRGKVVSELMKQKRSGKIQGICGRMGDLGTIDPKYDVAISTACPQLESIIVETVPVGQKCIEFLKTNNLGRATFVCLDKLPNYRMDPIQTPENAPRLFDLIKPADQKYLPAFYQALTDTLVANDLQQANRIAYGKMRYRVVTLDGQLIDKSGTMSGGGTRVSRGAMSAKKSSVDKQDLQEMEQSVQRLEQELAELKSSLREAEQEQSEAERNLNDCKSKQKKMKMSYDSLLQEIEDAKNAVVLATQNANPDAGDVKRCAALEKEMKQLDKQQEEIMPQIDALKEKIHELQEQILETGGVRLRSQQSIVGGLLEQIQTRTDKITKLQVEKATRIKTQKKLTASLEKKNQELEQVDNELEELQEKFSSSRTGAQELKSRVSEAQDNLETKLEQVNEIKEQVELKSKELNDIKSESVNLRAKLTAQTQKFTACSTKASALQKKRETLKLHRTGFETEEMSLELPEFSAEESEAFDVKEMTKRVEHLGQVLQDQSPNLNVLLDYKNKLEVYKQRTEALEAATKERDTAKEAYDTLKKKRLDQFMAGFTMISQKLKEMYQLITMGGNAELELVDSLDPFSEGIIFSVMPPKKSWKNIANLSGGEKTLSSLALVFALHHFKPTPLYVMDEIDAALDFRNVSIVANYIKQRTKNAQFVIISLRNNMFELADRLVGIYKTSNTSKSVTIDPLAVEQRTQKRPDPGPPAPVDQAIESR